MPILTKGDVDNGEVQAKLADAWLNIDLYKNNLIGKMANPLDWPSSFDEEPEKYIAWVMTRPEYFSFLCSEILNVHVIPTQAIMLREMWQRKFPMLIASRGFGKSFMLAVYSLLRILLMPKRKVCIAGAAFRQSKVIFDYMEAIYRNAPILRDIIGSTGSHTRSGKPIMHDTDMYKFVIGESVCTAIPIGDGSKIRGQRANDLITDEFASIPKAIFENVLAGFAAVKSHPIDSVKEMAMIQMAKDMGIWEDEDDDVGNSLKKDNQIVISGTAYYDFNHFADYWKDWHEIVCSCGDKKKIKAFFARKSMEEGKDDPDVPDDFDWRDYSIIRIPFEKIPPGFMDASQVARSKATIHAGIYQMEFGAVFSTDSNGFFKRSLIEACVASPDKKISFQSTNDVFFEAVVRGNPKRRYVYGIDPASERDNFSIVIIEMWPEHRRIVYGWTTNRTQHLKEIDAGLTKETDFYSYCARKIRDLMLRFPPERIMLDSQGGGIAIIESLHDKDKLKEGEVEIWPVIDPDKPSETDVKQGLHLVELVNFASADWTHEANHGLRKDFEDRVCLFPYFDAITVAKAEYEDEITDRMYDSIENCVMEIEDLKDELSIIIITQTPTGRDKWDTPEVKLPGGKKGRLRKDRYSALLMANMGARQIQRSGPPQIYEAQGGWASHYAKKRQGEMYSNEFYSDWAKDFYKHI